MEQKSVGEKEQGEGAVGQVKQVSIIVDESGNVGMEEAVLAVKRGADGQPVRNNTRRGGVMKAERFLNPQLQLQRKVPKTRRLKKKRVTNKAPRKTKVSIAEHAPTYEFSRELGKASCGLTFRKLMSGDAIEAKREMVKILSAKSSLKVGVAGETKDHGKRIIKTILVKVYGTEARNLLDSGAVPNVLSKEFVERLGI